ncbi:hypothetical protein Y1Q_0009890 [Alligator mississippiensis]|uniref:Uncharacterized protein n=1 Tax=Alligator mississippiensis TaxID=8496 RepID=A0A151MXD8_ALLMI|nr:hypothetical protein Y1Q_0009890 [Alligator mississippiensis]
MGPEAPTAFWSGSTWLPQQCRNLRCCTLVLLILLVPWAHLHSWFRTLSCNGTRGKSVLPHNLHCYLEGYLSQRYMSLPPTVEKDIAANINTSLGV